MKQANQQNQNFEPGTEVKVDKYDAIIDGIKCGLGGFKGKVKSEPKFNQGQKELYVEVFRHKGGVYNVPLKVVVLL